MNKRIYEFATQAGAYCETYLYGGDPKPPVLDNMDLEKFAQLIVQECMKVCKSRVGNSDYNTGRMHCVSDLKEHFGVE